MPVHAIEPFRRYAFPQPALIIFLKPDPHDERVKDLLWRVQARQIVIEGMDLETAAAWTMACDLWNMPCAGQG